MKRIGNVLSLIKKSPLETVTFFLVTVSVIMAGLALMSANAATLFGYADASKATVASGAQVVSDTTAADGKAVKFAGAGTATPTPTPQPASAGQLLGWGSTIGGSEFSDPAELTPANGWTVWDGVGYEGKGRQSPTQVAIANGVLRISGTPNGTTGAVAYGTDASVQRYGRWETRIRVPVSDANGLYHAVALLWPETDVWPDDGEIDYFEQSSQINSSNSFSVHHAGAGSPNTVDVASDSGWHTWALEWTPTTIKAYKDGVPYRTLTDKTIFPPVAMWHSFQLDWIPWKAPSANAPDVTMEVDWLRIYK